MPDLSDLKTIIVDQTPIVQIVGHYISITRKGNANLAICPFHQDSKPSLNVTNEKKMYKCFACNAGGNAIDFVVNYKSISFLEALEEISRIIGVNFDEYYGKKSKSPKEKMASKLLVKTTQLYAKFSETTHVKVFKDFINDRKLNLDLAATYRLGYAPSGNVLIRYLKSIPSLTDRKLAIEVAEEIGLIKPDQNRRGEHYDTFRDRVIFPIWDQFGHTIGYTSRVTNENIKPKYLNSKESFIFSKKNLLYGLHLAKESIRQKDFAILVEGNMDQVALYSKGFTNVVAIMGIALGENSLLKLNKITKNFVLALDSDGPGHAASERINKQCMAHGLTPRVIHFDDCKDPDDFLNKHGPLAMQKKIDEAQVYLDYQLNGLIPDEIPTILIKKFELLDSSFPIIAPLKNSLEASERLMLFAARLGFQSNTEIILQRYRDYLKNNQKGSFKHKVAPVGPNDQIQYEPYESNFSEESSLHAMEEFYGNSSEKSFEELKASENSPDIDKNELLFVQEVVQYPEVLTHDKIGEVLDFVQSSEVELYVLRLRDIVYEIDESEYFCVVKNITQSEELSMPLKQSVLSGLKAHRPKQIDEKMIIKLISETKRKLEFGQLRNEKNELKKKRKRINTEEEMRKLMSELLIIEQKLNKLKSIKNL